MPVFNRIFLFILLMGGYCALLGCRHVPFYRMTDKAVESLEYSRQGVYAYEHGDYDVAEKQFQAALERNESNLEVCRYYAETLWIKGKHQASIDFLMNAVQKKGTKENEILLKQSLGEKLLLCGSASGAYECAEKILELSPQNPDAWFLRAEALHKSGQFEEALLDYQKSLYYSPGDPKILQEIIVVQNRLKNYEGALAACQSMERNHSVNLSTGMLLAKAEAYQGINQWDEARETLLTAMRQEPDCPQIYRQIAELGLLTGNIQESLAASQRALELVPGDARSLAIQQRIQQIQMAGLSTTIQR